MNVVLKRKSFLLALVVILFFLWNQSSTIAQAATPAFQKYDIEIIGTGEVYQFKILNKVSGSTYQWSSSNTKVATVSKSGLITSKNKGTTKIKCKITYPSGKTKNLYSNVTVLIPATEIKVDNANLVNGAHVMMVGETYNFNRTLTPSNSSDKTYWSLDYSNGETSKDAVRIVNSSNGTVTALRRGKIVLVATAAKEATAKSAEESYVKDAIIIEVMGPSPEVLSAEMIDAKRIKVVFGTTIRKSTVINSDGKLSSNITIAQLEDKSGNTAKDPGTLTGSLSSDLKTLTITASNSFNGDYGVTFSSNILTTSGSAIYKYYTALSYSDGTTNDDTTGDNTDADDDTDTNTDTDTDDNTNTDADAPKIASVELSDNGMTNILTFTEKMDFSNFQVSNAKSVSNTIDVQPSTINFLNSESNYIFTSDGKSIIIDLTNISSIDYNKLFTVTISGITDAAGNKLANNSIDFNVTTSTTPRAQARPISVIRTSYDTITATFDRAIRIPGYAYVNSGGYIYGVVNPDNNKQVNYKLYSYEANLSGSQTVWIGHWDSYNVASSDTYANQMYSFSVYFITEKVRPILTSYSFNSSLNILTLTFSEKVKLSSDKGYLTYTMDSAQYPNNTGTLYYSQASAVDNVIEIMLSNITLYGNYSFTLPEGFAIDDYRNLSYSRAVSINNGSGSGNGVNKLSEPYSIYQSTINHSFIYIEFADKLDEASALDANNYVVAGAIVDEVKLINNSANGATIRLTLRKGIITGSGKRRISIAGLKGYNGSLAVMNSYSAEIDLIENKDPELISVKYNATLKNAIDLTFSEPIKGNMTVLVQERSTGYPIGSSVTVAGDIATITLNSVPTDGTYLVIYVQSNSITDLNGNESTVNPVIYIFANY